MDANVAFLDSASWDGRMHERLRWMRRHAPVHWSEPDQLFVVTRFRDVVEISKDQRVFTSAEGVRPGNPVKLALIDEGEPRHTRVRKLIHRGFTPRMVQMLERKFRAIAREAVDGIAAKGECDFVEAISVPLPLLLIAEMIGIRREDFEQFHAWSDAMIAAEGNLHLPEVAMAATAAFVDYGAYVGQIIESRRREPREDLVSVLVHAKDEGLLTDFGQTEVCGPGGKEQLELANDELVMLMVVLLVAGNETTRNGISGGMELLLRQPELRDALVARPDRIPMAVEEMLRLTSPVHSFARTATEDAELGGQKIRAGQKVLMIYPSANRDEQEFEAPDEFRLERNPHHLAFGIGPHFCLGANLARMEMRVAFDEVLRRLPDLAFADSEGAVIRPSALVRSCTRMRVRFTPEA